MRFPLRRIVLGFAAGASAGWVAGLLRRPKDAPPGTGADAAEHMPVEEFGDPNELQEEQAAPAEVPGERKPPRKALPETVTPPPGTETAVGETSGAAEPATAPEAGAANIEKAARRRAKKTADSVKAVAEPVREAAREGRAAVAERLADLDEVVAPPAPPEPEARRRRKRTE